MTASAADAQRPRTIAAALRHPSVGRWAWRVSAWAILAAVTAGTAHGRSAQIAAGTCMVLGAVAFQFTDDRFHERQQIAAIIVASVLGLAATLIAPSGLGEVPTYLAASRIPFAIEGVGRLFVVVDTVAVGAVVGFVSHSLVGALAGLGIPLLAQRAAERRELISERDRAQALLAEVQAGREAEAQAAALQERGRIARDMHDVLAHSLAGLSVQLQATRAVAVREGVGPVVLVPLDRAAELARDGLGEARAVVSTLRDPVGLGVDDLPDLIRRHPGHAQFSITGAALPVRADAGHAVYRAVQEALTNAARYAPGSPVDVSLTWRPTELLVRIDDHGLPQGRTPVGGQGSGLGLAGMDERIRAVGGRLQAGPREGGGWRVEMCLPA